MRRKGTWLWLAPPPRALQGAGWALLPLRAFLGFTFVFAGLQKLANPGFFTASSPASIQSQLAGAVRRSPIHALIGPLTHVAVPLGVAIALTEVAIGAGTLLGLFARAAAVGGTLLSFMLFLTISYHSSPYYTGSDIVFVFAWVPLALAGAGGVWSLDSAIANYVRHVNGAEPLATVPISFAIVRRACGSFEAGTCTRQRGAPCEPGPCPFLREQPPRSKRIDVAEIDRRTFAARGAAVAAAAVGSLAVSGVAAALGRAVGGVKTAPSAPALGAGSATTPDSTTTTTTGPSTPTTGPTGTTAPAPAGTRIGPARDVPVGGAASFSDPRSGDPSLVVQPVAGRFLAFDAVCPHAGCSVEYDQSNNVFVCPCHGSEFNGTTGAVEVGPSPAGLSRIPITEGQDGQLYVT